MFGNNNLLIKLLIALAVVFTTACNDGDNENKSYICR